jgi:hypothetical protein
MATQKAPNAELSRSRQTLSPDEAWKRRISQRRRKQKGWRLSAQVIRVRLTWA